jgi:superfamily II DNA or RNA helicase
MNATLREHLVLHHPGPLAARLRGLATFKRTGRLRPGERRTVRLYRWNATAKTLALPRGLRPQVERLGPLTIRDERVRRPAVRWMFQGTPRDYQAEAVAAVGAQDGGVVVALPGAGKTAMGCLAAATWQQPTLWVTHTLGLATQARAAATQWLGVPPEQVGFVGDEQHDWRPFTVAMIQTLARQPQLLATAARAFGTVIVDECFVAGTRIDGRPIEGLRPGDRVASYDPATETWAARIVERVWKRPVPPRLVEVHVGDRRMICTPNHPVWTARGWVPAGALGVEDWVATAPEQEAGAPSSGPGVADGMGRTDRQGGFDLARPPAGHRNGWPESYPLAWVRVDRVAVHERGGAGAFDAVCGDGYVYNLRIADVPTYTADGIVVHNCHHTPANSFQYVVSSLPAAHLLGLSATPDREDGLGPMLTALLGPRVVVPVRVLQARGIVLMPDVLMVPTPFRGVDGANWAQLEKARAHDPARNRLLLDWVAQAWRGRRRTLVLVERTTHADRLRRALVAAGIPARAIIGDTPGPARDQAFAATAAGHCVGIATKLANEGIDIPAIDVLVLGAASRARTRTIQQVGRVMRTAPGKRGAWVVDLADVAAPSYADQVAERVAHYAALGCTVRWKRGGRAR